MRGEPKRVRVAVRHGRAHVGYVTTTSYPDRDTAAFAEGSPYFEVAVCDLGEKHVALFQRYREHWLIHCGPAYDTTDTSGDLSARQITALALFALEHADDAPAVRVAALKAHVEALL